MDPAEDAHPLAAVLDGLADLDLGRRIGRLVDDDGLCLLELLELCGAACLTLGLLALAQLLLLGELVAVLLEQLGRLLLGRCGCGGVRPLLLALGGSLAHPDVGRVARAGDEGAEDRLVGLVLRAVASLVVAGRLVDVDSIYSGQSGWLAHGRRARNAMPPREVEGGREERGLARGSAERDGRSSLRERLDDLILCLGEQFSHPERGEEREESERARLGDQVNRAG